MQVLHILTDGTIPSPELLSTIRKLYDTKLKVPNSIIFYSMITLIELD